MQIADAALELGVARSMGRTAVLDNSAVESFQSTLTREFYQRHLWATKTAAKKAVGA